MDRYIPTGNEMISLPKINENTAGIEDFTYLSMQHKGLIEVRGSKNPPPNRTLHSNRRRGDPSYADAVVP